MAEMVESVNEGNSKRIPVEESLTPGGPWSIPRLAAAASTGMGFRGPAIGMSREEQENAAGIDMEAVELVLVDSGWMIEGGGSAGIRIRHSSGAAAEIGRELLRDRAVLKRILVKIVSEMSMRGKRAE